VGIDRLGLIPAAADGEVLLLDGLTIKGQVGQFLKRAGQERTAI
jgi:hypothetical protein